MIFRTRSQIRSHSVPSFETVTSYKASLFQHTSLFWDRGASNRAPVGTLVWDTYRYTIGRENRAALRATN